MYLPTTNPTTTKAWSALEKQYEELQFLTVADCFTKDSQRLKKLSVHWNDFFVDYSKQQLLPETRDILVDFAKEMQLSKAIEAYFGGEAINQTEGRAVLHTALRSGQKQLLVGGKDIAEDIEAVKKQMASLCGAVIGGDHKGYSGKPIEKIVNIGIGGSDLGPQMVVEALGFYRNHLEVAFISNVEGDHVMEVLKKCDPETTLFVVVSKSFTTQETLANAQTVRNWFLQSASEKDIAKHFVAVSTNLEAVNTFGIASDQIFPIWDWVGGRFSLWSAVGLSIALAVGFDHFEALLDGAATMDTHFRDSAFEDNIPVILALLSVWNNNFVGAETQAVIPYTEYLGKLPAYLQQAIMESNGKSVDRNGEPVNYQTGTIIWGATGTNAQHAFFQLMHQGTKKIPADFIAFAQSLYGQTAHQDKLLANFIAQTEALLHGKDLSTVTAELEASGLSHSAIKLLAPFKVFEGNRPSTSILIDKLTPSSLGSLVAMYEHKIFVEGVLWNIFSYDQWGVELGKQLANKIILHLNKEKECEFDASTSNLVEIYQKKR
ncbi:MAG: glucose-6-phosphate isomerase [Flavobacteriaceae bacterium]|nr:glucose-6-phosphate isomerase [Flavobacteriaceae bacterium]